MLFIDEVHRFSKSQQDVLLPAVENGLVVLIGATTENPYFEVNPPLLSRASLWRLHALSAEDLDTLIRRGLGLEDADADDGRRGRPRGRLRGRRPCRADHRRGGRGPGPGRGARPLGPGHPDHGRHGPGPGRPPLPPGRRRALRPDQRPHQERPRLGPRRRPLLDGPHDRGGGGSPLPGSAHGHPGQRGHRAGRSPGPPGGRGGGPGGRVRGPARGRLEPGRSRDLPGQSAEIERRGGGAGAGSGRRALWADTGGADPPARCPLQGGGRPGAREGVRLSPRRPLRGG